MFTPRWRQVRLIGLLLSLLCTINLVSSVSIAAADLNDELLNTNPILSAPSHIEHPSSLTTPPQKVYDLLTQLEEARRDTAARLRRRA